jgi:hypothetical protein
MAPLLLTFLQLQPLHSQRLQVRVWFSPSQLARARPHRTFSLLTQVKLVLAFLAPLQQPLALLGFRIFHLL